jgi:NADPH:quinone reductase-like Zn-dependent oxidoreductase
VGLEETKSPITVFQELIDAGKLTPMVDRTFPLSEVPEAISYLDTGDVLGKIVITV